LAQVFLETRPKSGSLQPLIDFLPYLEPKLWAKKQNFAAPTNASLGWITPTFYMAITRQQIELESCSTRLWKWKVL